MFNIMTHECCSSSICICHNVKLNCHHEHAGNDDDDCGSTGSNDDHHHRRHSIINHQLSYSTLATVTVDKTPMVQPQQSQSTVFQHQTPTNVLPFNSEHCSTIQCHSPNNDLQTHPIACSQFDMDPFYYPPFPSEQDNNRNHLSTANQTIKLNQPILCRNFLPYLLNIWRQSFKFKSINHFNWHSIQQHIPLILSLLLLLLNLSTIQCLDSFTDLDQSQSSLCGSYKINALGMESGAIPDSALTASSSFNEQSVGPQNARLNRELNGGAWCPAIPIDGTNSGHEWIQINLTEPYVITKIATQGRFGNGMGVEFVEVFWLDYIRNDALNWTRWHNQNLQFDIRGNVDMYSIVENILPIPLVGVTAVRILPISTYTRTCCLRLELFGCPYKDGPISYSMMDGQFNGRFGDLIDNTYDGIRMSNDFLTGGLGKLIDGLKGDDNYKVNKGFEWVAWQADTMNSILPITFQFDEIRNFSKAIFHCNNMFNEDIQVFYSAKIWFSLDGQQWSKMPVDFHYMTDNVLENARDVIIHLHNRVGQFVKFELHFAAKWIMISEVQFESYPINRQLTINELDFVHIGPITTTPIEATRSIFQEQIVYIIAGLIILLTLFIALLIILSWKRKEKITGAEYTTVPMKDVSPTNTIGRFGYATGVPGLGLGIETNNFVHNHRFLLTTANDPEYAVPDLIDNTNTGRTNLFLGNNSNNNNNNNNGKIMNNGTNTVMVPFGSTNAASSLIFPMKNNSTNNNNSNNNNNINNNQLHYPNNNWTMNNLTKMDDGKAKYYASTDVVSCNNNNVKNKIESTQPPLPPLPVNGFAGTTTGPNTFYLANHNNGNNNSILPVISLSSGSNNLGKHDSPPSSLSSNGSKVLKLNSSTHSTSLESHDNTPIHSSTKGASSPEMVNKLIAKEPYNIPQLNEKDVCIIDGHFGCSPFGECELGYLMNRKNNKKLVILKTLSPNVYRHLNLQEDFYNEITHKFLISSLCDRYSLLYGYISKHEYMALVMEYGDSDLKKYLCSNTSILKITDLIKIIGQIAEAMKQLHLNGFVHGDLAARNCLIYTKHLKVKITHSGSCIKYYENEYMSNLKYPIRWMSYESILNNKFTTKSDVFSFGVTVWEVMNYCQMLPHQHLTDEEILNEIYHDDSKKSRSSSPSDISSTYYNHPFSDSNEHPELKSKLQLPKPCADCPDEIYDLILECTQRCEHSRPEFDDIVYFLKKISNGLRSKN